MEEGLSQVQLGGGAESEYSLNWQWTNFLECFFTHCQRETKGVTYHPVLTLRTPLKSFLI